MLHNQSNPAVAAVQQPTAVAETGTRRETPHWSPLANEQSVFFRAPASQPLPLPLQEPALAPGENFAPIVTRLPPVEEMPAQQGLVDASIAPPPLPDRGVPATTVSVRRARPNPDNAAPPKPAATKMSSRAASQRKIPGQEFGVGMVRSVRFKEGFAVLEFENAAIVPPGSVIRAYHEFALSGKSPVCDLEVVDGGDGRTLAIARSGSDLTALNVGDRAIVLQ
jgi:hypothetical protein